MEEKDAKFKKVDDPKKLEEMGNAETKAEKKADKKANKEAKKKEKAQKKAENVGGKAKNKTATIVAIIVIVVLAIAIAISVYFTLNSPKANLNYILTALKDADFSKIENYSQLLSSSGIIDGENINQDAQKLLFEKLEWNIKSVEQDGDTATVELEVTNKDFRKIISNYMQKALTSAFNGQDTSDETMSNYLMDALKDDSVGTTTVTQTIKMVKQNGKWGVADAESFIYALLPGLSDAINSIGQIN